MKNEIPEPEPGNSVLLESGHVWYQIKGKDATKQNLIKFLKLSIAYKFLDEKCS